MLRQSMEILPDGFDILQPSVHGFLGRGHATEADGGIEIGTVGWKRRSPRVSTPSKLSRGDSVRHRVLGGEAWMIEVRDDGMPGTRKLGNSRS